ncbi:hypothetical protein THIARS_50196 [Thiomonas delicata]|uniref:Uncharacterized protein n=1 Tax=Thiomonas delicata TaxID=364030 RepID=A0A238D0I0_THIDL|nr:hypothetical protein THIARS_40204 [Thiomonas delicata]SBP86752.1 hypothetical protein THIARS_470002 [Thiomonas delicata]SBP86948.1 hypothetical protein THIARS_50196 [Thiomonas delicata]
MKVQNASDLHLEFLQRLSAAVEPPTPARLTSFAAIQS